MFETLNYIELSGRRYPIKCDLFVLEKAQIEFKSLELFELGITPWMPMTDESGKAVVDKETGKMKFRGKLPNIAMVNRALYWMACEGEDISAENEKRPVNVIDEKQLIRSVDIPIVDLAELLHTEFSKCFETKNAKTTQNPETATLT